MIYLIRGNMLTFMDLILFGIKLHKSDKEVFCKILKIYWKRLYLSSFWQVNIFLLKFYLLTVQNILCKTWYQNKISQRSKQLVD